MLAGPLLSREAVTVPRRTRLYVSRTAYVTALWILMCTAWIILAGTQIVRNVGDIARFGAMLFQILAPLQLGMALLFSALLAASAVAQEKDRQTLVLLLMTNLTNRELVLGKLLASLLNVVVLLAAALPLFMLAVLLGGVSFGQVGRVFAVTLACALAAGSLGSTIAFWREKTFQTLSITALALVAWLAAGELLALGALGSHWYGIPTSTWATALSPWQAIMAAVRPTLPVDSPLIWFHHPVNIFFCITLGLTALLNAVAILGIRVWNPTRQLQPRSTDFADPGVPGEESPGSGTTEIAADKPSPHQAPGRIRPVWDNVILWRELRTWAYGRKVLVVRLAYVLVFALATMVLVGMTSDRSSGTASAAGGSIIPPLAMPLVSLFVLSLVLVNAQAVTALTSERDGRALDLLLVTDISPKEFVFGKLGGVLYNTKEMVILPMLLCAYVWITGRISAENLVFLLGGLAVMYVFVAVVGIHSGMIYASSRSAIGVSIGTVIFLFIGVATCMRMMIAFSGSFQIQLQPFLAFMIGGGIGLYVSLGSRNPSLAIGIASFSAPFATFYALTSFILGNPLAVFFSTVTAYGFATIAMLVPAISEFDVATGRTTE